MRYQGQTQQSPPRTMINSGLRMTITSSHFLQDNHMDKRTAGP